MFMDDKVWDEEVINWFDEITQKAVSVQTETLRKIIERNVETMYLQKWLRGMDIRTLEPEELERIYCSLVPVSSHEDFEPLLQRIADGDSSSLLTQEAINRLSLSSGTTDGRPKCVPFTNYSSQTTLQILRVAAAYRSKFFPIRKNGRVLELVYGSRQFKTNGGLQVGTATAHYYASEEYKIKHKTTKSFPCSPYEVISGGDYKQSTYCHFLLGLVLSHEVEFITSTFAYSMVQAFQTFEDVWKEICRDIKEGKLSSRVTSPEMRKAVLNSFSANPDLAMKIEEKCKKLEENNWFSLIPQLWPNVKYIYSIMTGSMQPYLKKIRHYAGHIALVSGDYGASESWIGVNVDPLSPPEMVNFTVFPTFSYYEFIPLYSQREYNNSETSDFLEGNPIPLSQVKIGQKYEIVLTTFTGLYRYRLGDVVEVTGFHGASPKLHFLFRRKSILTVNIDKNTEKDLQWVVERGSQPLSRSKVEVVDFISHANTAHNPGHYVIYLEINGDAEEDLLYECCQKMDESFVDHGYITARKNNSIGPLELHIVEKGTFKKIVDYYIGNGAAISQFKIPRCTSDQGLLRFLKTCTIKCFVSSAYSR